MNFIFQSFSEGWLFIKSQDVNFFISVFSCPLSSPPPKSSVPWSWSDQFLPPSAFHFVKYQNHLLHRQGSDLAVLAQTVVSFTTHCLPGGKCLHSKEPRSRPRFVKKAPESSHITESASFSDSKGSRLCQLAWEDASVGHTETSVTPPWGYCGSL